VIRRAKGKCEYCGEPGFEMPSGEHYLETHHVIALAKDGADTVKNVLALCAGHHREAHYGVRAEALEKQMIGILARLQMKQR
jgi:5-methylcytosine-specific restriction protein A